MTTRPWCLTNPSCLWASWAVRGGGGNPHSGWRAGAGAGVCCVALAPNERPNMFRRDERRESRCASQKGQVGRAKLAGDRNVR